MVYMLLAEGFEETEAIAPLDILRRAGIEVSTVSLTSDLLVAGGQGITVKADITLGQIDFDAMEMLILPGGGGGVRTMADTPAVMDLIARSWKEDKKIAAICAAPSLLAKLGLLDGWSVVCHPSVSDAVSAVGGMLQPGVPATRDRKLVTGKAAGYAIDFGIELVAFLQDREKAEKLRHAVAP